MRAAPIAAALAMVVALGSAVPADAAPPRSAQRFADAALRAKVAINALRPEISRSLREADLGRCGDLGDQAPARAERTAGALIDLALAQALLGPTQPVLERFVADLEAIPTRDPALRSGRAAWRESVAALGRLPAFDQPCAALERWAKAGWSPAARPPVPVAEIERLDSDRLDERFDRGVARAARRLRRLGISAGAAKRFTGETLFEDAVDEIVVVE
jgi:hypothetical protein